MTTRPSRRFILAMAASVAPVARALAQAQPTAIVAAASDLQFVLPELLAAFRAATNAELRPVFGASGNLARQIRQGAPFELFLSADEDFVADLARDGFTRDQGVVYAVGRLSLIVSRPSPLAADGTLDDLAAQLAAGRVSRFAIANPEIAPYGRRAREALQHRGLWDAIQPRLVFGENIAQTMQFVTSGNAQGGIASHSLVVALAMTPSVVPRVDAAPIAAEWHSPLRQRMVLTRGAGPTAARFHDFLQGPAARAIFDRHGFERPA